MADQNDATHIQDNYFRAIHDRIDSALREKEMRTMRNFLAQVKSLRGYEEYALQNNYLVMLALVRTGLLKIGTFDDYTTSR